MRDFTYYNPTRIIFGRGAEEKTGRYAAQHGKKALLHYGGGSMKKNGVYDKVVESLRVAGVSFVELGGVRPNPRLSLVREGIALCKREKADLVLAVGGGSAIDSAKAIAVGAMSEKDIWYYYEDRAHAKEITGTLPVGVVLTIPAAGSESSINSVITNEQGWYKRGLNSEALIPRFAMVNPESNYTLPAYQTACGCADIFAHLLERYFTTVEHVDLSDRLIEAAMRTVLNYAPLAQKHPQDYDIRAEINWTGTIAHNSLLDRGRIGDWGSHAIEHELSGVYDIAHGAGLAIVLPAWMRYVWDRMPNRFMQFAVRVMDVDLSFNAPDLAVGEGIDRLERFFRSIGLPTRLSEANIADDRLREMADKAGPVGNSIPLQPDDILEIYKLAL